MEQIMDRLTRNYGEYLRFSLDGLKRQVDVYHINFTQGETDSSHLLVLDKSGLTEAEAFTVLVQRLQLVLENWLDLENYNEEDLLRWTPVWISNYSGSRYVNPLSERDEWDAYHLEKRIFSDKVKAVTFNSQPVDIETFRRTNPMTNERILKVAKSDFERLEIEFYIETERHYLLYNWFTTA